MIKIDIRYALRSNILKREKQNNIKVFGSMKTKGPKQVLQYAEVVTISISRRVDILTGLDMLP
jgi:hypothetical protein